MTAILLTLAGRLTAPLLIDGGRWQMIPLCALGAVFGTLLLLERCGVVRWWRRAAWRRLIVGLALVWLAISVVLPLAFPVFRFPEPSGPHAVGTMTYHWVDFERMERFTATAGDRRELMVQVWYPAKSDPASPRSPYVEDADVLVPLARLLGLPGFVLGHVQHVVTNAIPRAAVAEGEQSYPVLVFSHGRGSVRQQNTRQVEELVSHGYVVAAIDHPYAASGVVFPDGRRAELDPRMLDRELVDSVIPYLAEDVIFTLEQLALVDEADPNGILTGRLDLQRTGVFGVSLGAEVSAEACRVEPRLRVCLIMDVWIPAEVIRDGLRQPTMFMSRDAASMRLEGWSEAVIEEHQSTNRAAFERVRADAYLVSIRGTFHQDFGDAAFLSPFTSELGITGPIDGARAQDIIIAYERAFFDRHLQGRVAPLLEAPSRLYPEVIFERRPAGSGSDEGR